MNTSNVLLQKHRNIYEVVSSFNKDSSEKVNKREKTNCFFFSNIKKLHKYFYIFCKSTLLVRLFMFFYYVYSCPKLS